MDGGNGFQMTYLRPTDDVLLRIYCYDAGGNDGIMDTGTNTGTDTNTGAYTDTGADKCFYNRTEFRCSFI